MEREAGPQGTALCAPLVPAAGTRLLAQRRCRSCSENPFPFGQHTPVPQRLLLLLRGGWGPGRGLGAACPLLPAALRSQRRAARSLVGAHPSSKLSEYTCVYIGLMQPWNRGRETSEARGLKGQACRGALLQTPGAPWPGHRLHPRHPTARIHGARPSSSISLAYILQQYRDIPLCTPAVALQQLREQRPAPSPGCSAGTSGRGPAGGRALAVGLGPPLGLWGTGALLPA